MHTIKPRKTLRLIIPEWQSGDYDNQPSGQVYPLGARLLAFLAPQSDAPTVEVPIEPYRGETGTRRNGVVWQDQIIQQLQTTQNIINKHQPDRIITFGGTCLVSQAPFAYLNEHYKGKIGILWIDAHPDISTPEHHAREHAMVLGNLLGKGDPCFSKEVKLPFKNSQVLLIGINYENAAAYEKDIIRELGLKFISDQEINTDNKSILSWIKYHQFDHIVIHFDIDALDPRFFYSQFPNNPAATKPTDSPKGKMTIAQVTKIIQEVDHVTDIVGITFAEHIPWDALNLKTMMEQFSFMK